jgi:hypothetical protein
MTVARVLILIGYEKVNQRLFRTAQTLQEEGHEIEILMWDRGTVDEPQRTPEERETLGVRRVGTGDTSTVIRTVSNLSTALSEIHDRIRDGVDIVHASHVLLLPCVTYWRHRHDFTFIYDP